MARAKGHVLCNGPPPKHLQQSFPASQFPEYCANLHSKVARGRRAFEQRYVSDTTLPEEMGAKAERGGFHPLEPPTSAGRYGGGCRRSLCGAMGRKRDGLAGQIGQQMSGIVVLRFLVRLAHT